MRKPAIAVVLCLVASLALADDLSGLWKAKKRFGPDAHGPLLIERTNAGYVADFGGRRFALKNDAGELTFTLPNDGGGFHGGKLQANGTILGYWSRAATPVAGLHGEAITLTPVAPQRWRGMVAPLEDTFTFYLLLKARPDGSYDALLRNPERDAGTQWGVERLVVEGNVWKLMGKRGEVGHGAYDAENHVLRIDGLRGGSYEFERDTDESEFYPRGKNPARYEYRPPVALGDGWPAASLDDANIDRPAMERLVQRLIDMPMDSSDAAQVHALLIARHGKLVLEEYFHGEHRDNLHDTRSAGKSVASIIVGAAMQAGAPLTLSTPVYALMKGEVDDPRKSAMTLENLLTMSAGFFCDDTNDAAPGNEETMDNQSAEPDWYRFTMNVPLATPPGENSVYCSAMPHLALGMAGAAMRESPVTIFDRLVAGPMKMRHYAFGLDPVGHPYGGGSVKMLPRDFLKIGQLMLNGGTWEGRRILSRDYVARASSPLYHLRKIAYGYFWWVEDIPYKSRSVRSYSARGNGGNTVTVVPELDLVVATMGANYSSVKGIKAASTNLTPWFILPAVREAGDKRDAPVVDRTEFVSPYGPSKDGSRIRPK